MTTVPLLRTIPAAMVVQAVYLGFVIGNLVLTTAYALGGPRLAHACRVALWLNALALAVLLFPGWSLLAKREVAFCLCS